MSGVETLAVTEDEAGLRLDRWFRRRFPGLGHGRIEKLCRTGQVRVDGGRVKASTRLDTGQAVRVPPLGDLSAPVPRPRPAPDAADAEWLRRSVVHRDDDVIAINKPPGLAVQGGTGVSRHVDALLDALQFDAPERPRLVHRLDKDTGGLLLLGRNARAAAALAAAFRGRKAHKLYWALVVGVPKLAAGVIDAPLEKLGRPGNAKVAPSAEGKRAVSRYRVIEKAGRRVSWLGLYPETGRTHQLRVHCSVLGTPILGDGKYGGAEAFIDGVPGGKRLHLHARALEIPHPRRGTLRLEAKLAPELAATWRFFAFDPNSAPPPDFDAI
ncbi:MAG: RluA family pseudouridine synthase [Alphaproteobacteria bacterium]